MATSGPISMIFAGYRSHTLVTPLERSAPSARTLTSTRSRLTCGTSLSTCTSMTLTSFSRLDLILNGFMRSLSITIVMRDTCGLCVRPTVRLSILNERRRNKLTTRFRTPGLLSTSATIVILPCGVCTCLSLMIVFLRVSDDAPSYLSRHRLAPSGTPSLLFQPYTQSIPDHQCYVQIPLTLVS